MTGILRDCFLRIDVLWIDAGKRARRGPADRPLGLALRRQIVAAGLLALFFDDILAVLGDALAHVAAGHDRTCRAALVRR
jgi:hypothetical protein